jgi:hypothetical protein
VISGDDEWKDEGARAMVDRARRAPIEVPLFAEERVWRALHRQEPRLMRRLTWSMCLAGAFFAAALVICLRPVVPFAVQVDAYGAEISLRAGDTTRELDALSVIELGTVAKLVSGRHTSATLDRLGDGGATIDLHSGTLLIRVTPRTARAPFLVKTPRFTARVVGTVLRVAVGADGTSSLAVGHGAVEVQPTNGEPVMIRTGARWPAAALDVPAAGELERLGDDAEGVSATSFAVPDVKRHADDLRTEAALYEAGWRAWREQKDERRALAIWQRQRDQFPNGLLRSEVRTSIIDALVVLRRSAQARDEIERFLAEGPRALRAPEMHFVLGTLYRELDHDCHRAEHELAVALMTPSPPWADKARTALSACRRAPLAGGAAGD